MFFELGRADSEEQKSLEGRVPDRNTADGGFWWCENAQGPVTALGERYGRFSKLETMVMGFEVTIFALPSRKLRRERAIEGIERHPFARAFQSDEPSSAKFPQPSLEVRSEPVITRPRHSKAKLAHPQPDSFLLGLLIRGHFHPFVEPEFAERYRCLRASQQVRPPLESSALTTQCLVAPNR